MTDRSSPSSDDYLPVGYTDAVQDFIDGGGTFICWICGHAHYDFFTSINRHPDQIQIGIGLSGYANRTYHAEKRTTGTKSQDLFNIISFDTTEHCVKIARIGADYNAMLQHKDTVCFDYVNKEIIT